MLEQLFINICIFTSFLYFAGIVLRNSREIPIPMTLLIGIFSGVLGLILMNFTIPLNHNSIMDLRHLAIVTTAVYIGWIPALLSASIITIGRTIMFGVTHEAIVAALGMLVIGISCSLLSCLPSRRLVKIQIMNMFSLMIIFFSLQHNIGFPDTLKIIPYHAITSLLVGFIAYFIAEQIKRSNEQYHLLKQNATKDFLTSLNNVRQFDASYNQALRHAQERDEKLSLLLIDIDHFKIVNDTFGHPAGDEVLKELGKVLTHHSRSFDIVSRNGGEEFSILLLDCPHSHGMVIAERLREAVERHPFMITDDKSINITISIGVSTYPDTVSPSGEEIFEQADKALYLAKRTGRNKVCDFNMVQAIH
ncbi:diguanylate cyclase [Rossellomorea sp. SC111]|uniref:GGDEF domain-containing protein n=1 Tax=Rossellomorea sp. SC111 TaxID=2968985 RepID=UPI00215AFBBD|nr:diguanylate cyclase [Rossellomorea sp. SC111]MCR8847724.1 diguanylate cyclase [Rossellomorea sp. SC111]